VAGPQSLGYGMNSTEKHDQDAAAGSRALALRLKHQPVVEPVCEVGHGRYQGELLGFPNTKEMRAAQRWVDTGESRLHSLGPDKTHAQTI
jgi:hypothetical protein